MSRVCTLVALTAAALLASAGRASAAHVTAPNPAASREGVYAVNAVTAISILPSTGRAEVVVAVSGPVQVQDFVLRGPDRVVIDLTGARLSVPAYMYDKR